MLVVVETPTKLPSRRSCMLAESSFLASFSLPAPHACKSSHKCGDLPCLFYHHSDLLWRRLVYDNFRVGHRQSGQQAVAQRLGLYTGGSIDQCCFETISPSL